VLVEIVLKGVDVILKKNYPGNDTENYLIFDMDELYVECDIAENGSLVVIVSVKDISLRDCDKDENKNFIINKNYQYLIGTEKPKINTRLTSQQTQPTYEDYKDKNFIDYQLLMIGNDLNNIVNVNDLKIIVSLESLLNMYQFSMYYAELYLDKMYQVESWKKSEKERRVALNENESTGNKWEELNEEQFRKNNMNYMFNCRQKRFGPSSSELKWVMMTPGPGDYINPYTATGTRNTLLINGIYTDIRKGKEILRQKAKTQKPLKSMEGDGYPGVGTYDPDKVISIAYQNRKKAKDRKENEKLKIAFDSHIKNEKDFNELKSNLGPGIYYRELPVKAPFIRSPFQSEEERMKLNDTGSGLEPGHYNVKSYFDWNKKTYNVSYL
jgi:hypothetical protein